jgi:hypothetical protein
MRFGLWHWTSPKPPSDISPHRHSSRARLDRKDRPHLSGSPRLHCRAGRALEVSVHWPGSCAARTSPRSCPQVRPSGPPVSSRAWCSRLTPRSLEWSLEWTREWARKQRSRCRMALPELALAALPPAMRQHRAPELRPAAPASSMAGPEHRLELGWNWAACNCRIRLPTLPQAEIVVICPPAGCA